MAKRMGGTFDWTKVSEADMRALSEEMFDAADVPSGVREEYWTEFERMKSVLADQSQQSLEATLWGEKDMCENADVLSAEGMKHLYGAVL